MGIWPPPNERGAYKGSIPPGPKRGFALATGIEDESCDVMLGIPKENGLETESIDCELYPGIPKIDLKGFVPMGRVEPTGWVVVGAGIFDTPTIEAKGFEGIPIITEYIGVEGLPMTFRFDSVLIT